MARRARPRALRDLTRTARAAATSTRTLLRHFRQQFGQTPLQYLHDVRATRARMLLETSYLTVDVIAEQCGHRDGAMFRSIFRRVTGWSPAEYRERHRLRSHRLRSHRREWGGASGG